MGFLFVVLGVGNAITTWMILHSKQKKIQQKASIVARRRTLSSTSLDGRASLASLAQFQKEQLASGVGGDAKND
jgi:hypothetical protein